jgi:hypothetical protein
VSHGTWLRSLVIGVYAAASITSRAALFIGMLVVQVLNIERYSGVGSTIYGVGIPTGLALIGTFIACMLLLIQLKLRGCSLGSGIVGPTATWLYASALSTFINVRWVTAPATEVGFLDR